MVFFLFLPYFTFLNVLETIWSYYKDQASFFLLIKFKGDGEQTHVLTWAFQLLWWFEKEMFTINSYKICILGLSCLGNLQNLRWTLAGGSTSPGTWLEGLKSHPTSSSLSLASDEQVKIWPPSFFLPSSFPSYLLPGLLFHNGFYPSGTINQSLLFIPSVAFAQHFSEHQSIYSILVIICMIEIRYLHVWIYFTSVCACCLCVLYIPMGLHIIFSLLFIHGWVLRWFHILAIVNSAAMNIRI